MLFHLPHCIHAIASAPLHVCRCINVTRLQSLQLHGRSFLPLTALGSYLKAAGHLQQSKAALLEALACDDASGSHAQLWHGYVNR